MNFDNIRAYNYECFPLVNSIDLFGGSYENKFKYLEISNLFKKIKELYPLAVRLEQIDDKDEPHKFEFEKCLVLQIDFEIFSSVKMRLYFENFLSENSETISRSLKQYVQYNIDNLIIQESLHVSDNKNLCKKAVTMSVDIYDTSDIEEYGGILDDGFITDDTIFNLLDSIDRDIDSTYGLDAHRYISISRDILDIKKSFKVEYVCKNCKKKHFDYIFRKENIDYVSIIKNNTHFYLCKDCASKK